MAETVTWFLELVRHRISTVLGVKLWKFSSTSIPYGSMLGSNKSQPRIYRFCTAGQNGVFGGPLGLGTENGDGCELNSQILWSTSQDIIFSAHIHCHSSPSRVQLKRSRLCQSHAPQRPFRITQYILTWRQTSRATRVNLWPYAFSKVFSV